MPYHVSKIKKGKLGESSKIKEELDEFLDAVKQDNVILQLWELSDLLGAIEYYIDKYNLTINDLIIMKDLNKRVFKEGYRK